MSTLKVGALQGVSASSDAITLANDGTCTAKLTDNGGNQFANRNKIINGEFRVNQRNHSGSASHNSYTLDRWKYARSANTEFSTSQSTDTPDGFANSVKLDCISANGSTGAGDYAYFRYHIEGQDLQELNKGTSAAKVATLSFYVKCDITGTFAINVIDENNRMCNVTYTVSDTNWNRYIVTIPADTSGAIANTNATGLSIHFYIIAGSSINSGGSLNSWGTYNTGYLAQGHTANIVSTNHNWYMTGVQLEISDYATPFEHRSFAQELALCQRYFYNHVDGTVDGSSGANTVSSNATFYTNSNLFASIQFPVQMRTKPTLEVATGTNFYGTFSNGSSLTYFAGTGTSLDGISNRNQGVISNNNSGGSGGNAALWRTSNTGAKISFNAEL